MEEKIGRHSLCSRRVDAAFFIAECKLASRWFPIVIKHFKRDRYGGFAVKEDRYIATKSEVLSALADIKGKRSFPLPAVPAVEKDDTVFDSKATECWF